MKKSYRFGQNQLMILSATMILSPALRLFPAASARTAGKAAWLSALVSYAPLLLLIWFLSRYMDRCSEGEGLSQLLLRSGGPVLGRAFLALTALWLLLYGGFSLRAGANRLITTIYPNASPLFFSLTMGLLGLTAALGSSRALARFSKLVAPAVFGVLLLVLLFAAFTVDLSNLGAVTVYDAPDIAMGALPAVDVVAFVLYASCFLENMAIQPKERFRSRAIWSAVMLLLLFVLSIDIIGNFGAELTMWLTRPFFSLVRNLVFFGAVERIEAVVVSLWVFPDFLLFAAVLYAAQQCVRLLFGFDCRYAGQQFFDLSQGRYLIWLCGAASIVCAALIGQTPEGLLYWSLELIPTINMVYAFIFLPFAFALGKVFKRI